MQIIDAQIHLWESGLPINKAHRQVTAFTAEEAIAMMNEAGVHGAVINPPSWDPGAVDLAHRAVRTYPGRFAIMGSLSLDQNKGQPVLDNWLGGPNNLGLRFIFLREESRAKFENRALDWIWAGAEAKGIPISMMATDSFSTVAKIAEQYPNLKLTIDHLGGRGGFTELKDRAAMTHLPELLRLARYPNIAVKITGAPGYSAEAYPFPVMIDVIHQLYETFGPDKLFWGTDITKMPCSWSQCITMVSEEMPWLSSEDKKWIMGEAVRHWWGWV